MQGPGFKDFLTTGANDRLLISGLANGLDFNISTGDRYPKLSELLATLPDERPEEFEDYHDQPFLTRGDADWMFRRAVDPDRLQVIGLVDRVLQRSVGFAPGFRQVVEWCRLDIVKGMLGPFLGALLMFYLVDFSSGVTDSHLMLVGVALLALVLFAPRGLLGFVRERRWRALP